ncbi:MAG: SIS domain-containing protein [Desulfarculaceae bacterium]|nr:SIS domain-containing protein [Desulfarculaceae bacterium]
MMCRTFFKKLFSLRIVFGSSIDRAPENSIIFFPFSRNTFNCGISALVAFKQRTPTPEPQVVDILEELAGTVEKNCCINLSVPKEIENSFLGGNGTMQQLWEKARLLREHHCFIDLYSNEAEQTRLADLHRRLKKVADTCQEQFRENRKVLLKEEGRLVSDRLELLKDTCWCIEKEILQNIEKIRCLAIRYTDGSNREAVKTFKNINSVLNSMDRLEVRGRDSAGLSILLTFEEERFEHVKSELSRQGLAEPLKDRSNREVLCNNDITVHRHCPENGRPIVTLAFVYKFAAEIGSLGDNVEFIRTQIKNDQLFQVISGFIADTSTVSSHTRWASVGDITESNCHPVDNEPSDRRIEKSGIIHVSLNGDIDNYLELKTEYEARYEPIHPTISTDTKLIPLQIEHYLKQGHGIMEAFRSAVNDFEGSHAISMHTDLAPGKLFLAQKGSGQALFVGIAPDHYIAASELYGIVEETPRFIKLKGGDKGQIVVLDQNCAGSTEGISSFYYDNKEIRISEEDILESGITSRDIDRQNFPHYFLKEISESPVSFERTLEDKFETDQETGLAGTVLNEGEMPPSLRTAFAENRIKRILFIGQGTAGIAAQACAGLLSHYLDPLKIEIRALKASELSGFSISDPDSNTSMAEDLVVAISQSGTTTDTNRAVDIVKECGARTISIVNRRDSDITFKTDGVIYTSSGRDIEMSVASTKAFYSQVAAGAILGLHLAGLLGTRSPEAITEEINELSGLPGKMEEILLMKEEIKASADRLAVTKNYWATVGSGANKASADEIRIKLSELCYKTISSDYTEDKKHIDLSAEPLILICAAGTRESVLADIIKDTAIFHAHKASPVVITDRDENRFDLYAENVFKIPKTREHFAPVLNTLVGHIWGYYAALAINESSKFMYTGRNKIKEILDEYLSMGNDIYEVLLEKKFRESVALFYNEFSQRRRENLFPAAMGLDNVSNITLLSKYLTGRLPVSDFEMDFNVKGTPVNMINSFFENLSNAVNTTARPIDAIKHQAKTVTVGTSRIKETFEGVVFDELTAHGVLVSQVTNRNVVVLKNVQEVISRINGSLLYRVSGLNLLGEPTADTTIEVVRKLGALADAVSRVEENTRLKGTKNIIVREQNVYLGKGRKDSRSILVVPVLSPSTLTPNRIEYILSMNVDFKKGEEVSLLKKIKALGGKYTRIKDLILESATFDWDDKLLNLLEIEDLFGDSAEKISESIINRKLQINGNGTANPV